jgi:hypothetical protein
VKSERIDVNRPEMNAPLADADPRSPDYFSSEPALSDPLNLVREQLSIEASIEL